MGTTKVPIDNLITVTPKPDYDAEVLQPLHQQQEAAAERAALLAEQQRLEQLERQREVQAAQARAAVVQTIGGDCQAWMNQAGITDQASAYKLIMRESGCNPRAVNSSSGACGIGQQLPCGKWPHQWDDPVGAMIDMQGYVFGRYGSWAAALAFHYQNNWY